MRPVPLILAALLLTATACTKDKQVPIRLHASGEWFRVTYTVDGTTTTADAKLSWGATVYPKAGSTLTFTACRIPSDLIDVPPPGQDYWTDTLNVGINLYVYRGGSQLADASAGSTNGDAGDPCAELTYNVPE